MAVPVQVTDCYFPKDKYLNRRKNFCFVTFATQQVHASAKVSIQCHLTPCVHGPQSYRSVIPH